MGVLASLLYHLMGRCQYLFQTPWVESVWITSQSQSILCWHLPSDWPMLWTTAKPWLVCPGVALLHFSLMTRRALLPVSSPSWAPILCSALCAPYDGLLRAAAFRGDISHLWFQKGSVGNAFHCLVLCCRAAASYSKWKRTSNIKNYVQWKFLQTQDHRAKDCSGFSVVT